MTLSGMNPPQGAYPVRNATGGPQLLPRDTDAEERNVPPPAYPSREEAERYRRDLHDAVDAVRSGGWPDDDTLAWPEGLDRTLLRGLPLATGARNSLLRAGVMTGANGLTIRELLSTPRVGPSTVRHLLLGGDEFLGEYTERFEDRPEPVDVLLMRLEKTVAKLTPAEAIATEHRLLRRPPTKYHIAAAMSGVASHRIVDGRATAREKFTIAFGTELERIAAALYAELGPGARQSEVHRRIEDLLPCDSGGREALAGRIFRRALINEMGYELKADTAADEVNEDVALAGTGWTCPTCGTHHVKVPGHGTSDSEGTTERDRRLRVESDPGDSAPV